MLLMMLERGEPIHSVVFFDTGWEFPQMYDHIRLLENKTGVKIWWLHSRFPFEWWMLHRPIRNKITGKVHRIGNGWPSPSRRWCSREKADTLNLFAKAIPDSVYCVGYAKDEPHRGMSKSATSKNMKFRFPLQEWGITEADALQYCLDHGYNWGGLYEYFKRVSCYCCPLQRIGELRKLRKHFPDLWAKMLEMDKARPEHNRGFKGYKTVHDFELRFAREDKQLVLL